MSKDKKFHKLIESQDQESKQRAWENLKTQIESAESAPTKVPLNDGETIVLGKRRNLIIVGCFFLIIVALLIGGLYLLLTPHNGIDDPMIEDPSDNVIEAPPDDNVRYSYTAADYTQRYIDNTIKDISAQNNDKILYFDWYAETEELETIIAEANGSNHVVFYLERTVDPNTGYSVQLGVTDSKTEVDIFAKYNLCAQNKEVEQVNVKWMGDLFISYATFEYNGYIYYLEVSDLEKSDDILNYVRELLSK